MHTMPEPPPAPTDPDQPYWDPEAQTLPPDRRRALQDERLQEMVRRVFEVPVGLFRRKLAAAGVESPHDLKSVDDLARVPTTVKQDLRDSEAEHPPVGDYRFADMRQALRLGSSTGTTGTPTIMLWTRKDIWVENECAARNMWRQGLRPGMILTQAHPAYLYGGGLTIAGAHDYFGVLSVWVPPPETDELAEQGLRMWMRIRPDVPFAGFSLNRYREVATKLGLDPESDVGLPRAGLTTPKPGGFPLATAGAECFSYLGGACREHNGAHLNDDYAWVQAVDPETGREVPDGEWGSLVVTTFGRDNCMLRYDLEEACRLERTPCPCGETSIRGWWGGRFKDLLPVQGKRVWVLAVEGVLFGVDDLTGTASVEFVVVRPQQEQAPLVVRVEAAEGRDRAQVASRAEAALRENLGVEASVEVVGVGELPRSGYKQVRVVDA